MKSVSQWTGRAPQTRSVVSVCRSPVNNVVSVPFTSYIVAPGMWPAGCAVTSRSPMSTLSPKSIIRYRRRAVRKSPSSKGASKPSASAIFRESARRRSATSAVGGVKTTSTSCRRVIHGIIPVWSRWAWLMNIPSTGGAGMGYFGGGPADGRPPPRLVRIERRAVEEMVRRGQSRVPARDHRDVVPAAVRRHDHAGGVADQHDVVLHCPRRGPEHRDETARRLAGYEATIRHEFVEQVAQIPTEPLPGAEADVCASGL